MGVAPGTGVAAALAFVAILTTAMLSSPLAAGMDWVYEKDDRLWLFGGHGEGQDFDITDLTLDHRKLNFGFGREAFPALIQPEFGRPGEEGVRVEPATRVIAVAIGGEARAYPIELMQHHEVVNDIVGDRPVMVAYCILADLAAVYDRTFGERIRTFAPSGYTYAIPGVLGGANVFVLWDRDTESLWLPSIGKGVSGPMRDAALEALPQQMKGGDAWGVTTWGNLVARHPDARVLKSGQKPAEGEAKPAEAGRAGARTSAR